MNRPHDHSSHRRWWNSKEIVVVMLTSSGAGDAMAHLRDSKNVIDKKIEKMDTGWKAGLQWTTLENSKNITFNYTVSHVNKGNENRRPSNRRHCWIASWRKNNIVSFLNILLSTFAEMSILWNRNNVINHADIIIQTVIHIT